MRDCGSAGRVKQAYNAGLSREKYGMSCVTNLTVQETTCETLNGEPHCKKRISDNIYPSYSVLMAVYNKETPEFFETAIQSMMEQSVITNDFVIVCDGPLSNALNGVIEKYCKEFPEIFQIIRLNKNCGLGNALNIGIKKSKNELIARMDSDDISMPERCKHQIAAFMNNQQLSLCGGDIAEFEYNPADIVSVRHVPKTYEEILQFAKKRCPMNHMAVMYKKSSVEAAGGYVNIKYVEDYYLWVRMLQKGYRAENLNEILVRARVGNGMYERRGGLEYIKANWILQRQFLRTGFITYSDFVVNCLTRFMGSVIPGWLRKKIYMKWLRADGRTFN